MTKAETMHLAIIPDGNRRWATGHSLQPWKGHEKSAENFGDILDWCYQDPRVGVLTIWCFSTENWKRDEKEVHKLMDMLSSYLKKERETFMKRGTRLIHAGRTDRFSPELAELLQSVCAETANNDQFTLQLAIDYGGQDELLRAINKLDCTGNITDADLRAQLDQPTLPDIDLVIRTSGEHRTSNFFLWQSTYAEWIFSPKLFPEFTTEDLATCVSEFASRSRRFGA